MIKVNCISFLLLLSFFSTTLAQNTAIGQWRVHLPFNKANLLTQSDTKIFCGVDDGIFTYSKTDNSLETITKVDGLSDIQLSALKYYSSKDILLVGYENGNLDMFQGNKIYNISDIKRKNILGSKRINNILFVDNYAYLSCAFGVVVLNLDKKEVKDSYFLSISGSTNAVYDLATDGTNLFAASDSGIFSSNITNPNINYFGSWNLILSNNFVSGPMVYNHVMWFNQKLYMSFNQNDYSSFFVFNNGIWNNTFIGTQSLHSVQFAGDEMIFTGAYDVKVTKEINGLLQKVIWFNNNKFSDMRDAIIDKSNNLWIGDHTKGLFKAVNNDASEFIIPDGPHSKLSAGMQILNDQLWVGHSVNGAKWDNLYSGEGFSTYKNNHWITYDKTNVSSPIVKLDTLYDFMSLAIDPRNSDHVFLGTRGTGLLDFENGQVKNYYNEANSTLKTAQGNPGSCQLGGISFDRDYNLWMGNSNTAAPMSELKTDGTWQAFSFPGVFNAPPFIGELMIDSYGQKWMDQNGGGVLVFDDTYTLGPRRYNFMNADSGGLPSNDIRAMVEDRDGQLWMGTAKGVAVFYNPGSALSIPAATAQQILLKQDNTYQYLLATNEVTSIAIDGANRKWFGTTTSGIFLMSADGTQQISHFTAANSPLLSDNILTMAINQKSGEVFIGTDHGIISYKSDANEGDVSCNDTYVYPNPVYHDYSGPIAIKGVMNNGNVKITDISGTLVYETTALGGQAIWNGKNFKGEKAHTGVYLVFCSDADGTNTCITKLLLFN